MNRRRLIILSFSLICLILLIGGFLYWYSEQLAEQRLQDYIGRLTDEGFTIEEHSLADFHVDAKVRIHFFGDFRSYAKQQGINHMYFDRGIHALYFLLILRTTRPPSGNEVEANIFYYK